METAKSTPQRTGRRNDEKDNGWAPGTTSLPAELFRRKTIAEDPELVMLIWPQPITISGLTSLGTGNSAADVQIYTGAAGTHPGLAMEDDWKMVKVVSGWKSLIAA